MSESNPLFKVVPPMHKGHVLFEINHLAQTVRLANVFEADGKLMTYPENGCEYVSALNMKNAIKKYNKGK